MFESLIGSIKQGFSTLLPHDFCVPCFLKGLAEGIGLGTLSIGVLALASTFAAPIAGAVAILFAIVGVAGFAYMAANWKHMDYRQKSEALGGLIGGALVGGIKGGIKLSMPSLAPILQPGGTLAMGLVATEVAVSPIAATLVGAGIGGGGAAMMAGTGGGDSKKTDPCKVKKVDDILEGAHLEKATKTKIYSKEGGFDQATKDFEALGGNEQNLGKVRVKDLPDNQGRAVLRETSTDGRPTLEIQPQGGAYKVTAIRYNKP